MAADDLAALKGMVGNAAVHFTDAIFGFHAQQGAEKCFKARIASLGGRYARTHDLLGLAGVARALGVDTAEWETFAELTNFAVVARYQPRIRVSVPLHRPFLIDRLSALMHQRPPALPRRD